MVFDLKNFFIFNQILFENKWKCEPYTEPIERYEERLRQKNALIAQIAFQNKLNAEELKSNAEDLKVKDENLKNYQKIVKDQQDEITNLNDEIKKINAQESKLTTEELEFESEQRKIFRKIVKDQHNEIRKLYEDVRTKGKVKPSFQKISWSMDPCTINYGPLYKSGWL